MLTDVAELRPQHFDRTDTGLWISKKYNPGPGEFDPAVSVLRDPKLFGIDRRGRAMWPIQGGMDGAFYNDSRPATFQTADLASITLAATQKALWDPKLTLFPAQYWFMLGKTVYMKAMAKITTGATPGNFSFAMGYGAGDAPAVIVSSVARAAIALSGASSVATIEGYATLRTTGTTATAGTLSLWGQAIADLALMLSTNQPNLFPSAGVSVVSNFDATVGTNALTFQLSRSGSTAEASVIIGLAVLALN